MDAALQPEQAPAGAVSRRRLLVPLFVAALATLTFLTLSRAPLDLRVDADTSLCAVLNYANQQGLQFGTDLVFTYGPLGYLMFFYYSPHAAVARMAVETALCFTVALGLCLVAWCLRLAWRFLLLGIFVFLAANIETRTDLVIDVGFLCWGLLCFVESGRRLVFAALAFTALAVFGALAKTSILFGASLSMVLLAGAMVARGQWRLGAGMMAGFGAGLALLWMAVGQNLWHLGAYVRNALVLARGYNQTLHWEPLPSVAGLGWLLMVLAVVVVTIRAGTAFEQHDNQRAWRRGLLLAWLASLLFLTWKHGFVRGDAYHVVYFFGFAPVLLLALEILPCEARAARIWARGFGAVGCLLAIFTLQSLFFAPVLRSLQQPFRNFGYYARCLVRPAEYRRRMNDSLAPTRVEARLPALRDRIGQASVDVFGEQQFYALYNDLNYRPRPVFQSYAACNRHLMRLNEQFYLSPAAPEYVLFALGAIDRRFPPLADAMVLRHLLINFEPVADEAGLLLLKSEAAEPPQLTLLREGAVRPGDPIVLQEFGDTSLWLEITLEPTLFGRLREFFYHPSTVRLAAWREPGIELLTRRRAPAPMLAAGFLASPLLLDNEDVQDLYAAKPLVRPAAYSVEMLPGEERSWLATIRFRVYRIENRLGEAKSGKSLPIPGAGA